MPFALGCGCNIAAVVTSRAANAAARARYALFVAAITGADRGRQDAERDALVARLVRRDVAVAIATQAFVCRFATRPLGTVVPFRPVGAIRTVAAWPLLLLLLRLTRRLLALTLILALSLIVVIVAVVIIGPVRGHVFLVIAVIILVILRTAAALLLLLLLLILEAGATFLEDAKIMIGELKVIFGLDAVPGELGIPRHALVFFEKLGGVAALARVAGVTAAVALHSLGPLPSATATAATLLLTIVDQVLIPCRTGIAVAMPKLIPSQRNIGPRASKPGAPSSAASAPPLPPSAHQSLGTAIFAGVGLRGASANLESGPVPVPRCNGSTRIFQAISTNRE